MEEELRRLQRRFSELAARAARQNRYTYTAFLTPAEQDLLLRSARSLEAPATLLGGFEGAERRLACFGDEAALGYPPAPPVCCLRIAPAAQRFASDIGHRDFLGALMGLGIKREFLGDILVEDRTGWLFCLEEIAPWILDNLTSVGRTTVVCARSDPPEAALRLPKPKEVVVSSERLDGLISAVWDLSRSKSKECFDRELVFVNGLLTDSPARQPSPGDVISVRGLGRFRYEGLSRETRKGRLRVTVRVW